MLHTFRRRTSPALLVALVALFVALAGSATAAIKLKKNSVTGATVKDNSLSAADTRDVLGAVRTVRVTYTLGPDSGSNDIKIITAECPTGTKPVSGGGSLVAGDGEAWYSQRSFNGWSYGGDNDSEIDADLEAIAYCAKGSALADPASATAARRRALVRARERAEARGAAHEPPPDAGRGGSRHPSPPPRGEPRARATRAGARPPWRRARGGRPTGCAAPSSANGTRFRSVANTPTPSAAQRRSWTTPAVGAVE